MQNTEIMYYENIKKVKKLHKINAVGHRLSVTLCG